MGVIPKRGVRLVIAYINNQDLLYMKLIQEKVV